MHVSHRSVGLLSFLLFFTNLPFFYQKLSCFIQFFFFFFSFCFINKLIISKCIKSWTDPVWDRVCLLLFLPFLCFFCLFFHFDPKWCFKPGLFLCVCVFLIYWTFLHLFFCLMTHFAYHFVCEKKFTLFFYDAYLSCDDIVVLILFSQSTSCFLKQTAFVN